MLNAGGYICISDPELGSTEFDTFTCFHCNVIVKVVPKADMDRTGSMCRICMKMVCAKCAPLGCSPFEKKIEALEAKYRALRSYGI